MIKAVIFDIDNTLYNYNDCHEKAMEKLQQSVCSKYSMSEDMFLSKFVEAKVDVKNQLKNTGASHNRMLYMQVFLEKINRASISDALELYDIYWDFFLENMILFPYVLPLLSELKEMNILIGILTDLTSHIQHRKLHCLGIIDYIKIMVTSEEAGKEKPSSIAFERLKRKIQYQPCEILMIGDSMEKDVYGAINAGMNALLFTQEEETSMKMKVMEFINDQVDKK